MKILLVNWVYGWGSTGAIVANLKSVLESQGHDVFIACGVNRGPQEANVYEFSCERNVKWYRRFVLFGMPVFGGSIWDTHRFKKLVKEIKPDVLHIHCLNCNCLDLYRALRFIGESGYKTIVTHHAEIYYTGSCEHSYNCMNWIDKECFKCDNVRWATGCKYVKGNPHKLWIKMKDAFSYFNERNLRFTAVSPWLKKRAELSNYLNRFECDIVLNGVDTTVFSYLADKGEHIQQKCPNNYILHVTAQFNTVNKKDIKGGWYIVEIAKRNPGYRIVVVTPRHSNLSDLPQNVVVITNVTEASSMADLYRNARVTVITSKRETFSMVCAESLCCGTPVVGFRAGGPESIAIPEFTSFVDYGNIDELEKSLMFFYNNSQFSKAELSRMARLKYSKQQMVENYLQVYNKLLK